MACCIRWGISGIPIPIPIPPWLWDRLQQRKQPTIQVTDWLLFLWLTLSVHIPNSITIPYCLFVILLTRVTLLLCWINHRTKYTQSENIALYIFYLIKQIDVSFHVHNAIYFPMGKEGSESNKLVTICVSEPILTRWQEENSLFLLGLTLTD